MITRREIVKAGAGLTAILASGRAPAAVVRSMLAARASICGGERLPYDAEVEYLESTGTQWIVISIDNISRYVVDFYATSSENLGTFIAVVDPNSTYLDTTGLIRISSNVMQMHVSGWYNMSASVIGRHLADMNAKDKYFSLDSERITKNFVFGGKYYVMLSSRTISGNRYGKAKYYGLKIWDTSDMLTHDLIPVRRRVDGVSVGEMFDRVTGTFAERHGTFVIGPDKPLTANS